MDAFMAYYFMAHASVPTTADTRGVNDKPHSLMIQSPIPILGRAFLLCASVRGKEMDTPIRLMNWDYLWLISSPETKLEC